VIQPQSYLNVGTIAERVNQCASVVIGAGNRRYGNVGDVIIGVVKDAIPNMAVKTM